MRRIVAAGIVVLLAGAGALAGLVQMRRPEETPALRGERLARELGCFGCHGPGGAGGVAEPTSPAGTVPGWEAGSVDMYVEDVQQIREWILLGAPSGHANESNPRALVPMPAYEGLVSVSEVDDLVAYFLAVSGWAPDMPEAAYLGRKIAARLGCFGCHGPSGMGGVRNPGSFKGHIPPWDGLEFLDLVRDDAELREWILDGKVSRLWSNPVARHFLEAQTIRMPAYRTHISDDEVSKIVAYIRWLRSRG